MFKVGDKVVLKDDRVALFNKCNDCEGTGIEFKCGLMSDMVIDYNTAIEKQGYITVDKVFKETFFIKEYDGGIRYDYDPSWFRKYEVVDNYKTVVNNQKRQLEKYAKQLIIKETDIFEKEKEIMALKVKLNQVENDIQQYRLKEKSADRAFDKILDNMLAWKGEFGE